MPRIPKIREVRQHGRSTYFTIHAGGRRIYLGTDPAAAYQKAGAILDAVYGTRHSAPTMMLAVIERWLESHRTRWHAATIGTFGKFAGKTSLAAIDRDFLVRYRDWLIGRHRAPRTVRSYVQLAARVLRWANERGWLEHIPPTPRTTTPMSMPRDVSLDRLRVVFDELPARAARPLRFMLETGARPGEVCGLQWSQVDLARRVIVLEHHKTRRTGRPRSIFLTDEALSMLREVPVDQRVGCVFLSRLHRPYTVHGLRRILSRLSCPITPNQLRHTFTQAALDRGVPLEILAAWLGHSGLRQIQTYAQVRSQQLRRVAEGLTSPLPDLPPPAALPSAPEPDAVPAVPDTAL